MGTSAAAFDPSVVEVGAFAVGSEFVHGVMFTNISETQSDFIVQYLCEFAFTRDARKDPGGANKAS